MESKSVKACIFCGCSDVKLTSEHVYPDWLSRKFDKRTRVTNEILGDDSHRIWTGKIFQLKLKKVCGECNNGWMSKIENDAKDILSKVIFARKHRVLKSKDQRILALWAQKTCLVTSKAIEGGLDIPSSFYTDLYNRKSLPSRTMMVTIGYRKNVDGSQLQPIGSFTVKQIDKIQVEVNIEENIRDQIESNGMVWASSLALGHVVFQVIGSNFDGKLEVSLPVPAILPVIRPSRGNITWPREVSIEQIGGLQGMRKGMYGDAYNDTDS